MNLEELIRDVVARGELTHLSLSPVHGGNGKMVGWRATFTAAYPAGGHTLVTGADPVVTLCAAITETKLKRRASA